MISDKDQSLSSKREIRLEIDEGIWKRLEEQVKFLRELRIPELKGFQRAEDLAVFYIEQLSSSDQQLSDNNRRFAEALQSFSDRGVNMRRLLNQFTRSSDNSDEEEDEEEIYEEEFEG